MPDPPRLASRTLRRLPAALGRRPWPWVFLAALALGLAFQGSRGLWEPDEGYYVNAAVGMLDGGGWLVPRVNGRPFLDKPPLVYWSLASGMALLGPGEWGARAGHALWFAGSVLLVGLLGGGWWGRRTGVAAALVYATSLGPFLAANVVTPDTLLAFASVLAYYAFWRLQRAEGRGRRLGWGAVLGLALGLGVLAKGPALLVMAAPLAVYLLARRRTAELASAGYLAAGLVFLALAVPWYALVIARLPGAGRYLLDNQVLGRLVGSRYQRNSGWLDGFGVYLPTLLLGALPWCLVWLGRRRRSGGSAPRAQAAAWWSRLATRWSGLTARPVALLLVLWLAVPLAVFLVASSRLPLYVLPLFAPIALATAHRLAERGWLARPWHPAGLALAVLWVVALVGLKAFGAEMPYPRDSRRLARELRDRGVPPAELLVTVDTKKNGLALYGYDHLEQVTASPEPYPFFAAIERLGTEIDEMRADRRPRRFLVSGGDAAGLVDALRDAGIPFVRRPLDDHYLVFETPPAAPLRSAAAWRPSGSRPRRR